MIAYARLQGEHTGTSINLLSDEFGKGEKKLIRACKFVSELRAVVVVIRGDTFRLVAERSTGIVHFKWGF